MSYSWGPETPKFKVRCGDNNFIEVTQNLLDALQALQGRDPLALWIDQICIDQDNEDDKNVQLPYMAEIYKKAQEVIVWVGNSGDGSEFAMDFLKRLATQGETISPHLMAHLGYQKPMSTQLHDFLSRPWFSRVWTLQEAAVASKCTVHCGADRIPWSFLEIINRRCQSDQIGHWSSVLSSIATARDADSENIERFITAHVNEIAELNTAFRASTPAQPLALALERHRKCGCSESLDRIYAIWAFLSSEVKDAIGELSYKGISRRELYAKVARVELVSNEWPKHLGAAGRARQKKDFRKIAPSWVPDWTYPQRHHTFWVLDHDCRSKTSGSLYQATSNIPQRHLPELLSNGYVRVQAKVLDVVAKQASPFVFSSSALKQKTTRMNELRAKTPPSAEDWIEIRNLLVAVQSEAEALKKSRFKQIEDCLDLALKHASSHVDDSDVRGAVHTTLVAGAQPAGITSGMPSVSMGGLLVTATDEDVQNLFHDSGLETLRLDLVQNACRSRVFFITKESYVGLGPGLFAAEEDGAASQNDTTEETRMQETCALRDGDSIAVIKGCVTPFVIRQKDEEVDGQACWELVGECYVQGIMKGEAFEEKWAHVKEEGLLLA